MHLITPVVRVNILSFILAGILFAFNSFWGDVFVVRFLAALTFLWVALGLFGLNGSLLLAHCVRRRLSLLERFTLTVLFALVGAPGLLVLENELFSRAFSWLPFVNTAVLGMLLFLWYYRRLEPLTPLTPPFKLDLTREQSQSLYLIGFSFLFVVLLVSRFAALPDYDPYYWLSLAREYIHSNTLVGMAGYRPFFTALIYLISVSGHVDLYATLKYALPFVSLVPLLPALLVASRISSPTGKLFLLFLPLAASASYTLYSTTAIPQAVFNALLLSSAYLLLYASLTRDDFFSFAAGTTLFFSIFYHQLGSVLFLIWAGIYLFRGRGAIIGWMRKNRLAGILIIGIFLFEIPRFAPVLFSFTVEWGSHLFALLPHVETNFTFPFEYTNIDGNRMGWPDSSGIAKYYLYYAGPTIFLALFFLALMKKHWHGTLRQWIEDRNLLTLFALSLFFFVIAEVFPRLFNSVTLFLPLFGVTYFTRLPRNWKRDFLLITSFGVTLGGAFYVNSLKQYIITPAQLNSAEWIQTTLPVDRIIISYGNKNLLKIHGGTSHVIQAPGPELYYSEDVYRKALEKNLTVQGFPIERIGTSVSRSRALINDLDTALSSSPTDASVPLSKLEKEITNIRKLLQEQEKSTVIPSAVYIYFAKPHPRNPYLNRPYTEQVHLTDSFYFDQHPERFRRIYTTPTDEVILWEVIREKLEVL